MNMISQGQMAASQRKVLEAFVAGVAVAALAIALAWGAFTLLSASNSVAASPATVTSLQEPGLLEQRAGERRAAVAVPSTKSTIATDSLVEQRRGERGGAVAIPSTKTKVATDGLVEHRRFQHRGAEQPGPSMEQIRQTWLKDPRYGFHGPIR